MKIKSIIQADVLFESGIEFEFNTSVTNRHICISIDWIFIEIYFWDVHRGVCDFNKKFPLVNYQHFMRILDGINEFNYKSKALDIKKYFLKLFEIKNEYFLDVNINVFDHVPNIWGDSNGIN